MKVNDYNVEDGKVRQCSECGMLDVLDTTKFSIKQLKARGLFEHSGKCGGVFVWRRVSEIVEPKKGKAKPCKKRR